MFVYGKTLSDQMSGATKRGVTPDDLAVVDDVNGWKVGRWEEPHLGN